MNEGGKSDDSVVPAKPSNNAAAVSQGEHGRQERVPDTEPDPNALSALDRVRKVARVDREARFTTRLHHVDVDRLPAA